MIPYEVDPSLHGEEPQEPRLDDGFTRPGVPQPGELPSTVPTPRPIEPVLSDKSDF